MREPMNAHATLAYAVQEGLTARHKRLPAFLLYDDRGSALFEEITRLPEYYLTRAEHSIFVGQGRAIARCALSFAAHELEVLELGAGTATKSQILLRALAERQGRTLYVPADLSCEPLLEASRRLDREEAEVDARPLVATHELALRAAQELPGPLFIWFLGSSIGNYEDDEAARLLVRVREVLGERGLLLLGADTKKSAEVLVRAYDDAQGVTAAFNKNLLVRINRELGGHFDPTSFRHVAVWNEAASRMEMHLESARAQEVAIDALEMSISFGAGERIHTESSHKYDDAHLDDLLSGAGLAREHSFTDADHHVAVHLVRSA